MSKGRKPTRGSKKTLNVSNGVNGGTNRFRVVDEPVAAPNPSGNRADWRAADRQARRQGRG